MGAPKHRNHQFGVILINARLGSSWRPTDLGGGHFYAAVLCVIGDVFERTVSSHHFLSFLTFRCFNSGISSGPNVLFESGGL